MVTLKVKPRHESLWLSKGAFPYFPPSHKHVVFCAIATPTGRVSKHWAAFYFLNDVTELYAKAKIEQWLATQVANKLARLPRGYAVLELVEITGGRLLEGATFENPTKSN